MKKLLKLVLDRFYAQKAGSVMALPVLLKM
jgi:hypothetical protein